MSGEFPKEERGVSGYVLHLSEEENITLSAAVTRRLIDSGDGDAALLYICLVKNRGSATPETLCAALHWSEARRSAAEAALARMGLVGVPKSVPEPMREPERERPSYTREDVARRIENDGGFAALLREVERKLGPLSSPSVGKLLGLYEDLGLPSDVIFLLVHHCIEQHTERYGTGLPTMRQIEQEGYAWARRGLLSTASANEYLKSLRERRQKYPAYMAVLQLGERKLSPGEEKYLAAWVDMGFPAETVALAYDKTVLRCHEFKWSYCNGILKKWHEKGLYTPEQTAAENAAAKKKEEKPSGGGRNDWMKQYL